MKYWKINMWCRYQYHEGCMKNCIISWWNIEPRRIRLLRKRTKIWNVSNLRMFWDFWQLFQMHFLFMKYRIQHGIVWIIYGELTPIRWYIQRFWKIWKVLEINFCHKIKEIKILHSFGFLFDYIAQFFKTTFYHQLISHKLVWKFRSIFP